MSAPYIDDKIIGFLDKNLNQNILDIACGQGYLAKRLSSLGYKNIYCADIDDKNFKLNKHQFNFTKVDCDGKLPFENSFFDTVITSETIEHLQNPINFFIKLNAITKANGTLIVTTPNISTIFCRIYFLLYGGLVTHTQNAYFASGHKAILTDWLIKQFAKEAKFALIAQTYNCAYFPVLRFSLKRVLLNNLFGQNVIYKFSKC